MSLHKPRVGLFVTCLVDLFRPSVGFAAVKLLRDAGCEVTVPRFQTCCGQPAYNSGANENARRVARVLIQAFEDCDYVVAPSGSCAGMVRRHYPSLFSDDEAWVNRARDLASKTYELVSFLTDILKVETLPDKITGKITYHDSCSGLRELGIKQQPRDLLIAKGLTIKEMEEPETCCGFGGTFCVKYPHISNRMVEERAEDATNTEADLLLGGDMGCLLNLAGKLRRQGSDLPVRHVAEILAGETSAAPIGSGE